MTDTKYGTLWSRNELILALYLYCQIPFAKTKANNLEVIRLAQLLGRTPTSVARKLGNFGAFDPLLAQRGVVGLTHVSRADRSIWEEFHGRWEDLVRESQFLLLNSNDSEYCDFDDDFPVISKPPLETEREGTVLVRLCQSFFRRSVLSGYNYACCICGLDLRSLLVASHIVPWSANISYRSDPQNGLCLCNLHDKAFDRGLIAIGSNFKIHVSSRIKVSKSRFVKQFLAEFEGVDLTLPRRLPPKVGYLSWHFQNIYTS